MNNKKRLIAAAVAASVITITAGVAGAGAVLAQTATSEYLPIVEELASTFSLDPAAVQQVFEDHRDQMLSDRLDELVADGEITSEQKDLIIAKQSEIEEKRQEILDASMTAIERKNALTELNQEVIAWAEEQGIDGSVFRMIGRGEHRGRMHAEGMM